MSFRTPIAVVDSKRCRTCGDCLIACPIGQNIDGYIAAIMNDDIDGAAVIIRNSAALPGTLGRMCPAPCEAVCRMPSIGRRLPGIRDLKRFAVSRSRAMPPLPTPISKRFGVVGAGPAGLAAAHCLQRSGATVEVFEARNRGGGLLAFAVPEFILPLSVLDADIEGLKESGIQFHWNTRVGRDVSFEDLTERFDGVIQATGLAGAPGEWYPETRECTFSQWGTRFRFDYPAQRARVLIIGADNRALSCARIAVRLSAARVIMAYPLPASLWPIGDAGQKLAQSEGIELRDRHAPVSIGEAAVRGGVWMDELQPGALDWLGTPKMMATGERRWIDADICIRNDAFRPLTATVPGRQIAGEAAGIPLSILGAMSHGRASALRLLQMFGVARSQTP